MSEGAATLAKPETTIGGTLARGRAVLVAADIDSAGLDARLLLERAIGCTTSDIVGHPEKILRPEQVARFDEMIRRRATCEPVAQILESREFWSLAFHVTRDTLAPRPDSETTIEAVLDRFTDREPPQTILDLGTGTGCLLLSMLHEFPSAHGIGVDISRAALDVARRNAAALGLDSRATFLYSDWSEAVSDRFDLILCNPPYVSEADWAGLDPEVRDFEPREALVGGTDGLDVYRTLIPALTGLLTPNGIVALEFGQGQERAISSLLKQHGLGICETRKDLAGIDRCILATVARI